MDRVEMLVASGGPLGPEMLQPTDPRSGGTPKFLRKLVRSPTVSKAEIKNC